MPDSSTPNPGNPDENHPESDSPESPSQTPQHGATGFLHERSWTERNGFPHWLPAIVWVVVAFLLFQIAGNTFAVVYLMAVSEEPVTALDMSLLTEHLDMIFLGNSVAQILFLGVATWLLTGLSTTGKRSQFLRFRSDERTLPVIGQTVILVVVMQPTIWMLGWLNMQIPMPESYMAMEEVQIEMIKSFLTSDHVILMALIHVGLVPSICEEILFRGYVQRLLEKSWGVWAAIIVGGLLFGLFHIRLTQFIPLALIGMLLSWLVWRSNSIYPGIVGHFVNNGGNVLVAAIFSDMMMDHMTTTELPPVWLVLASIGGTVILLRFIHQTTRQE